MTGKRTQSEQIADGLTYILDTAAMLREQRKLKLADRIEIGADGLMDGMRKRGLSCSCRMLSQANMRYRCSCLSSKASSRKKKGKTLSGPFTFDGLRCRDAQGAFVPVSQCKGKVGRNKAGRFVSVK
ncbi:hypothetical protein LCGC14_0990230 [marine sediment metagenome]|uniref:Uncharacterized protein n=1 Tax=marine sediment metagenome TaxID=412755 RepID=A0A0F9QPE2_9ZZZZ